VEHQHLSHSSALEEEEEHGHGESESVIVKKMRPNEILAKDMQEYGITAESLAHGSHPIESEPYYSHMFGMNPRLTTNKGIIKITGKNFDFVQVLQKH
jgi:hypothetical protein